MNLKLDDELARRIQERVERGDYDSVDAVVRDALRVLDERDAWRADVNTKIAEGIAAADRGELIDGEKAMREIRERLERRRDAERAQG